MENQSIEFTCFVLSERKKIWAITYIMHYYSMYMNYWLQLSIRLWGPCLVPSVPGMVSYGHSVIVSIFGLPTKLAFIEQLSPSVLFYIYFNNRLGS